MKPLPVIPEGDIGNTWLLNLAIAGGGFKDQKLNSLASVFIRKVDLAAYEYALHATIGRVMALEMMPLAR